MKAIVLLTVLAVVILLTTAWSKAYAVTLYECKGGVIVLNPTDC